MLISIGIRNTNRFPSLSIGEGNVAEYSFGCDGEFLKLGHTHGISGKKFEILVSNSSLPEDQISEMTGSKYGAGWVHISPRFFTDNSESHDCKFVIKIAGSEILNAHRMLLEMTSAEAGRAQANMNLKGAQLLRLKDEMKDDFGDLESKEDIYLGIESVSFFAARKG